MQTLIISFVSSVTRGFSRLLDIQINEKKGEFSFNLALVDCKKALQSLYWRPFIFPFAARCTAVVETGTCRDTQTMWYYDPYKQKCFRFNYGGCEGNENRFDSQDKCKTTCTGITGVFLCLYPINNITVFLALPLVAQTAFFVFKISFGLMSIVKKLNYISLFYFQRKMSSSVQTCLREVQVVPTMVSLAHLRKKKIATSILLSFMHVVCLLFVI